MDKILPTDAKERKGIPVYSGFVNYFPRAIAAVAKLSREGNDQHNPGTPLHWDRSKSGDELDAMMRHVIDGDWVQVAWRAMANLEKSLEKKAEVTVSEKQKTDAKIAEIITALDEEEGLAR